MNRTIKVLPILILLFLSLGTPQQVSSEPDFHVKTFGESGDKEGQIGYPRGMHYADNKLYLSDSNNDKVLIYDNSGNFLKEFNSSGSFAGALVGPTDVDSNDTSLFVADFVGEEIQVFDFDGNYQANFTLPYRPYGIDHYEGKLYVTNVDQHQIHVYNASTYSEFLPVISSGGSNSYSQFEKIRYIDVYQDTIYATDLANGSVKTFSTTGAFTGYFGEGDSKLDNREIHTLNDTYGISVKNEHIFVTDLTDKIAIYDLSGTYIRSIEGVDSPQDVLVTENSIYVDEFWKSTISQYRIVSDPTNVEAMADDYDVSLSWNIDPSNGFSSPEKYRIYRNTSSGFEYLGSTVNQYFHDVTAQNNKSYNYKVQAVSTLGESYQITSNTVKISPAATVTETVTDTNSTNTNSSTSSDVSSTSTTSSGSSDTTDTSTSDDTGEGTFVDNLNFNGMLFLSGVLLLPVIRRIYRNKTN